MSKSTLEYESAERILVTAIKHVCNKLIDLTKMADKNGIDLDMWAEETKCGHHDWVDQL